MSIIHRLRITALLLIISLNFSSAQDFHVRICISGLPDSQVILSHRFGMKFYTDDTVMTDEKGCSFFEAQSAIPAGMYQIVLPDKKYMEFFLDKDQVFSIQTSADSPAERVLFTGSPENHAFHHWQQMMNQYQSRIAALQGKLQNGQLGPDSVDLVRSQVRQLQQNSDSLWDSTITELDGTLAGAFIKGLKPVKVPENLSTGHPGKDQLEQYKYFIKHFFDDIDLGDVRLLRTPLIETKMDQFFNRIVVPVADSIIPAADRIIRLTGENPTSYQFVVQYLLNLYSEPKIMGTDAVYVHLAENYYLNGNAPWIDQSNLEAIRTRVNELKPLLLGSKAPPLEGLITPEGQPVRLSEIGADIVILYFWEPDCGHCKETTPKLFENYNDLKKKGVEIIAIDTRPDKEPWLSFIDEYKLTWINAYSPSAYHSMIENYQAWSTPRIFILDSDRSIIAKDLGSGQVAGFIEQYLKYR